MTMIDNRTIELREKLTERGIAYHTTEVHGMPVTLFNDGILTWSVTNHPDGYMIVNCGGLTPEQAIAATLGNRKLTAEQVRECVKDVYLEGYSDGAMHMGGHIDETDWQAIADKLNAMLSGGTCKQGADMDVKNKVMRVKSGKYQDEKYVVEDYAYNVWGSHNWYQNLNNFAILNFIIDHKDKEFNPETAVYGKIGCFGYVMLLDELEEVCDD